jgi:hypothetical protein
METTFDRRNRGLVRHVDVFGGRCRTAAEQYVVLRGDAYKVGHSLKRAARIAQGKDRQNMAAVLRTSRVRVVGIFTKPDCQNIG